MSQRVRSPLAKISGEIVKVSGEHVYVESGVGVQVQSGVGVLISGQHVFVESGVHVVAESGLGVLISGQHVFVESGVNVIAQSGLGVLISGQHVFLESGAYFASGGGVTVQSGTGVLVSGQSTAHNVETDASWTLPLQDHQSVVGLNYGYDGTGPAWIRLTCNALGQLIVVPGIAWPATLSGLHVYISGQHVYVESGVRVIVQSGIILGSGGNVVVSVSGNIVSISGAVQILSGSWYQSGTILGSGGNIVADVSGFIVSVASGVVLLSGIINATWLSGLRLLSGGSILVSGQGVIVGTATLSGLRLISGQSVTIASGTYVNWVQASGTIALQSGEIHVMSGAVTIYLLSSEVKINNSGNPMVVGAISHGIALWSSPIISVTVKALSANSGDIYLGGHATNQGPYSGQGFLLEPGEAINLDVDNTGKVHCFSEVSGDRVTYAGIVG